MAEWVVDRCGNLNARFENRPIMVLRAGARQGPAQSGGRALAEARRHARRGPTTASSPRELVFGGAARIAPSERLALN